MPYRIIDEILNEEILSSAYTRSKGCFESSFRDPEVRQRPELRREPARGLFPELFRN